MEAIGDLLSSSLNEMFKKELDRIQALEGRLRSELDEVVTKSQAEPSSDKWVKDCRRWCERTETMVEQCELGIPAWKIFSWHKLYYQIKEHRQVGKKVILKYKQLWDLRRCLSGGVEKPPSTSKDAKIIHLDTCFNVSCDPDEIADAVMEMLLRQFSPTQRRQRREYKLIQNDLDQLGLALADILSYVQADAHLQSWEKLRSWMADAQAWCEEAQGLIDQWKETRGWKTDARDKIYQQIKTKRQGLKKKILQVVPFLVLESETYTKSKENSLVISVYLLRKATDQFSELSILGKGGSGVVYKGKLSDGTKVAVRRMEATPVKSKTKSKVQEEIEVVAKLRHRHLVSVLGYCIEGNEKLIVYEFMPRGSLSQHLFDHVKHGLRPLTLKQRLSIALDVGRGVEYLHGLAPESFFTHRDLKPGNILLDDELHAKVAEFGLGRFLQEAKASVDSGYLSPEYAVAGRVTSKVDVYSFGVILMELITGRRASLSQEGMHLTQWFIRMRMNKETFRSAIDPVMEVTDLEEFNGAITRLAELALQCTLEDPFQRPDMRHAVSFLAVPP